MAINVFLIISNIILLVAGQTLWKLGLNKIGSFQLSNLSKILFSPYIISGVFSLRYSDGFMAGDFVAAASEPCLSFTKSGLRGRDDNRAVFI